jgi:hypothetical protein
VRRLLVILAIVLAGLGALAIRVVIEGRGALADGDAALASGNSAEAIRAFEASARWYLPLAPHVDEAYDRLRGLTRSEDPGVAVTAWRAIRSAARATRWLVTPHAEDLEAADVELAKLAARDLLAAPSGPTADQREIWHRARLARDPRPRPGAAAAAAFGIVLWLTGFFVLVRRGVAAGGGGVVRRPALVAAAMIVVGLVCWAAGLYNA